MRFSKDSSSPIILSQQYLRFHAKLALSQTSKAQPEDTDVIFRTFEERQFGKTGARGGRRGMAMAPQPENDTQKVLVAGLRQLSRQNFSFVRPDRVEYYYPEHFELL